MRLIWYHQQWLKCCMPYEGKSQKGRTTEKSNWKGHIDLVSRNAGSHNILNNLNKRNMYFFMTSRRFASCRILSQWRCVTVAAGAHKFWFHLYRIIILRDLATESALQSAATVLEQFLQTASLGEFERRLTMLTTFRCNAFCGVHKNLNDFPIPWICFLREDQADEYCLEAHWYS